MFSRIVHRVLDSFSIGRLIVVSLVARVVVMFFLSEEPSHLGPDEGTYAGLASWVANSRNVNDFPAFGAGLYNTSRTLAIPAAALIKLGVEPLLATRIISLAFGLLSIYFFTKIVFLIFGVDKLRTFHKLRTQKMILVIVIIYAFLPSNLIWSTLGLRESSSQAMILACVFFLLRLRGFNLSKATLLETILAYSLPILTLTLSFGGRRQTAFVFVFFFCFSILFLSRGRNFFRLASVILLGTFLGLLYSTTPTTTVTEKYVLVPVPQGNGATIDAESLSTLQLKNDGTVARCEKEGDLIKINSVEMVCVISATVRNKVLIAELAKQSPVKTLDLFEARREVNRVGAQTALSETNCTKYYQLTIQNITCNAKEFPYRITAFLTRPLPIIDMGSKLNNFAAFENLIWILLLIGFVYSLSVSIQRRFKLEIIIPTSLFIFFFSSLAALYEGNLGTAFRHKSTILWGLLLVIAIGIDSSWRQSEEERQEEKPRYAS